MENKKVLIIDDDVDLTRSFQVHLENNDFSVSTAVDGKDGMEKMRNFKPDLVLLDVMMETSLEGLRVAHEIKKDSEFRKTPILVITGMRDVMGVNIRDAFSDLKALPRVFFIHKPVDLDELVVKTQKLTFDTTELF